MANYLLSPKSFGASLERICKWFFLPAQRGLAVLSVMIMQSPEENINSLINIRAVGNFAYERQTHPGRTAHSYQNKRFWFH